MAFVNKSHLTDKTTTITWQEDSLKQLVLKRAVYSEVIEKYIEETATVSSWEDNIERCFDVLFSQRVYNGPKEARTMS